jgi:hypothetical protein
MKFWFRLTLVCCLLLCLCRSLPQAVDLNHGLPIVGLRPEFDRGREPAASDAPTVSVVDKHEIRSASRWTSCISDPRLCVDCGPSWSTRLGDPWATGTDRAWTSCRSSGQTVNSNQHLEQTLLPEVTGSNHQFLNICVSQEPLASSTGARISSKPVCTILFPSSRTCS